MTTRTDRELLELAAKAAGLGYLVWTPGSAPIVPAEHRIGDRACWHPFTDDGDAMRLAVKLGIDLTLHGATYSLCYVIAEIDPSYAISGESYFTDDAPDGDPCAATRRAIVRAAAAIGSAM